MTKDINAVNVFKAQARRLHKHIAAAIEKFSYSNSLEAIAAVHGAADWRTLIGTEGVTEAEEPKREFINIFKWQFLHGDASKPIISSVLVQDEAGIPASFTYRNLRRVDSEALDALAEFVDAGWEDEELDPSIREYLSVKEDVYALDWGTEWEPDGFLVSELESLIPDGPGEWVLGDGRKVKFLFQAAVGETPVSCPAQPAGKPEKPALTENDFRGENAHAASWVLTEWQSARALANEYADGDVWGEHPDFPKEDWQTEVENGDTWASYWGWLAGKLDEQASQPRYIVTEGWGHIFDEEDGETDVRFVYDRETKKIVAMQLDEHGDDNWVSAPGALVKDVKQSLDDNEVIENFEDYGDFIESKELPDWADTK